jgi:hypothetical protein
MRRLLRARVRSQFSISEVARFYRLKNEDSVDPDAVVSGFAGVGWAVAGAASSRLLRLDEVLLRGLSGLADGAVSACGAASWLFSGPFC